MKTLLVAMITMLLVGSHELTQRERAMGEASTKKVRLPSPRLDGRMSVEKALQQRRSIREYELNDPLTLEEVAQLLWAAQGVTSPEGFRTAPSAGALYPLEVYLVAGSVKTLRAGVYRYRPRGHEIVMVLEGDKRRELCAAALDQSQVRDAPAVIALSAVYERTTTKYRERGNRYVHMEIGHAAQNVLLQAEALGLGTVPVGAFSDEKVRRVLGLAKEEHPLYLVPVGRK